MINIWGAPARAVANSFHRIEAAHPGRLLLGIGVGHPELNSEFRAPYAALVNYLDELDGAGVPASRRVVAALGPRMLDLAAQRSAGAHPYLTTPEHTAFARERLGGATLLTPEHKVVLTTDAGQARAIGRKTVGPYMELTNYRSNWSRLGFTTNDFTKPGTDRFIDAMVAHGDAHYITRRLNEHRHAGADHVPIQVLGGWDELLPTLAALAGPLGLAGQR